MHVYRQRCVRGSRGWTARGGGRPNGMVAWQAAATTILRNGKVAWQAAQNGARRGCRDAATGRGRARAHRGRGGSVAWFFRRVVVARRVRWRGSEARRRPHSHDPPPQATVWWQRQGCMAGGTEWCSARLMRLSRRGHGSTTRPIDGRDLPPRYWHSRGPGTTNPLRDCSRFGRERPA